MIDKRLIAVLVVALMAGWLAGTLSAPYNPIVASQFQTTPVLSSLTSRVASLEGQVQSLSSQLASTTSQLKAIASQLDSLQTQVDGEKAYSIVKRALANPGQIIGSPIATAVVDAVFQNQTTDLQKWISLAGKAVVQGIITTYLNSKLPTVIWNDFKVSRTGTGVYDTQVVTYFPIVIDTGLPLIGQITVAKVSLVVGATTDVVAGVTHDFRVVSVGLV